MKTIKGELKQNETWSGEVYISGSLVIRENVTVTVLPGTWIFFLSPERCDIIVKGTLVAIGEKHREIIIGNKSWRGGMEFSGDKVSILRHCEIKHSKMVAVNCRGKSRLEIQNSKIINNKAGIAAEDAASINLSGNEINNNTIYGLSLHSGSRLSSVKDTIRHNETGVFTAGESVLVLMSAEIESNKVGIECCGKLEVKVDRSFINGNDRGIRTNENCLLEVKNCDVSRNKIIGIECCHNAVTKIISNRITENKLGVFCRDNSRNVIESNKFSDNEGAIACINNAKSEIIDNTFENNRNDISGLRSEARD
ncbi:MAG: right-handed parallel beta-helix repeat-containing protein [Elusimicrobiota bacterium]